MGLSGVSHSAVPAPAMSQGFVSGPDGGFEHAFPWREELRRPRGRPARLGFWNDGRLTNVNACRMDPSVQLRQGGRGEAIARSQGVDRFSEGDLVEGQDSAHTLEAGHDQAHPRLDRSRIGNPVRLRQGVDRRGEAKGDGRQRVALLNDVDRPSASLLSGGNRRNGCKSHEGKEEKDFRRGLHPRTPTDLQRSPIPGSSDGPRA